MTDRPQPPAESSPPPVSADDYVIRPLGSNEEFLECVALQKRVWGEEFSEQVPLAILKVGQRIGGVTAGAFGADGRMVAFVFGLTGVERGRLVHWSDMLAVLPEARDRGLGRRLKEFQRSQLEAIGVERMYWTFDPLVARNGYLNLAVLGASVVEYIVDMYGPETSSQLHRGVGTDRLLVVWPLVGADTNKTLVTAQSAIVPLVYAVDGLPITDLAALSVTDHGCLSVEVPSDIEAIQAQTLQLATTWRMVTREALTRALDAGWRIAGFERTVNLDGGRYLLTRRMD